MRFGRRAVRVPLAAVSVLALLGTIAWVAGPRAKGLWDRAGRLTPAAPPVVTLPAPVPESASSSARAPSASPTRSGAAESASAVVGGVPPLEAPAPRRSRERRGHPAPERYVLETGPLPSPEAADRLEDELNGRGFATVRFRKQDVTRVYVVTATGFPSIDEARRAATQLGRGAVIETAGTPEVLIDRAPSLGEAIAKARPLRANGFEVRVSEASSPAVIYHIRYGQFATRSQAQDLSEELAKSGIKSRVVKLP